MKTPGKVFVDTNVLVYANDYNKPEGKIARVRITQLINSGSQLFISPQVLREYVNAVIRDALENKQDIFKMFKIFSIIPLYENE